MTLSNEISADEFVEYATYLFGAQWRDDIASRLGLPRKALVLMLASGDAIPQKLANSVLILLEEKLEEISRQQTALKKRISFLRGNSSPRVPQPIRSRTVVQYAC